MTESAITFSNIRHDFTMPCPECGVPACGRDCYIWFEEDNNKHAIIFDGSYFNLSIEEFLEKNNRVAPEFIPNFIQKWGYEEKQNDYTSKEIDRDDFIISMKVLLKFCKMGKWITKEEIEAMLKLATDAKNKDKKLHLIQR